jgi:catechol 2,3-dioxygenase
MDIKQFPVEGIKNAGSNFEVEKLGKLHGETNLGRVHLNVAELGRSVDFYQRSIGLRLEKKEQNRAYLGVGGDTLLVLSEIPGAVRVPRRSGLYHFAILAPSRRALGKSLRNLIDTGTELQGGADHLVSEALYIADPDGNGIEIYRDRPRDEWQYENGQIKMATDPLDYQGILETANGSNGYWDGLESSTRLGHMHLHVAQLDEATDFYEKVLGFDFLLSYMGSASFLSAGGYHHHIGLNTWNGVGAAPPPPDAAGLRYFSVNLVGTAEREKLVARLDHAGWPFEERSSGIFVRDPSQNGILFELAAGN